MATKLTLMSIPQEILLMILKEHFSSSVVEIPLLPRRSKRHARPSRDRRKLPTSLSILFVNRVLFQIGIQCFYKLTEFRGTGLYQSIMKDRLHWSCSQLPWNRIRYLSSDLASAAHLNTIVMDELLSIRHLREINIFIRFFSSIGMLHSWC